MLWCAGQQDLSQGQIPPVPPCRPTHPARSSASAALTLPVAACPRVLVTATEPVQITFSFIPSDTGCGHNKIISLRKR